LLALLGGAIIVVVSRLRVKDGKGDAVGNGEFVGNTTSGIYDSN